MADFSWKTTYVIYAQPEEVFEALTDPGIVAVWSGELSVIEPRVGGHVEFFDGWINGEVTHFSPGKELGFTWKPTEWDKRTAASKVHLRFMPHEAGTDLVLVHTGFPSQAEADKHANGWVDFILDPLNDYFVMNKEA
jgi:uncharacterized protein YndB with AHSA1/START domain